VEAELHDLLKQSPRLAMMFVEMLLRRTPQAQKTLARLVDKGCSRERILFDLGNLLRDTDLDTWKGLLGFNGKQTQAALRRMRKTADELERINASLMGEAVRYSHPKLQFAVTLPDAIRLFAKLWEKVARGVTPRKRILLNTVKRRLVQHVIDSTGRPHDREVSALIAAVTPQSTYDEVAHRMWRLKHMPSSR